MDASGESNSELGTFEGAVLVSGGCMFDIPRDWGDDRWPKPDIKNPQVGGIIVRLAWSTASGSGGRHKGEGSYLDGDQVDPPVGKRDVVGGSRHKTPTCVMGCRVRTDVDRFFLSVCEAVMVIYNTLTNSTTHNRKRTVAKTEEK